MTETLKCPECSAPLDYPADGGPAVKCSFCGSTVLLPGAGRASVDAGSADFAAGLGPLVSKALEMAQMSNHVRAGNKIEAIRIYRQSFGADLLTAKNAIDSLSAGRPILLNNANSAGAARGPSLQYAPVAGGKRNSPAILIVILVFVGLGLAALFFGLMRGQPTAISPPVMTVVTTPALPAPPNFVPPAPAEPASFARMAMQFGSEGMGAGQFTDHRTIALDGRGHLYVGEYSNGRVQVFDTAGNFVKAWSVGSKTSLLSLAASREGTVYAVTPGHILCFEGATGLSLGEAAVTHDDTQFSYMDAFASLTGDIYAISGHDIVILNSDGQIKTVFDASQKVGEDVSLVRIAVNGTGEIYALDRSKGIFKFAPDGRYINRFGSTDFNDPMSVISAQSLAVDGKGRVYVSGVNPAVRVFSGDGRYIDGFGKNEVAFGLAIDDHDNIYACFRNDHQVRKFTLNPTAGK
jgi:ribosomal protein S27E